MKLVVGLGNPGKEYVDTRHNVGFMAVDEIIRRHSFLPEQKKFKGLFSEGNVAGEKVYILKPQTYMNKSGVSVAEAVRFYKIPLEDVIVIYDELDIPLGKVKAKLGGGSGGHNGIKSIDQHVGVDYERIRIGIGHPGDSKKVSSYVLHGFASDEQSKVGLVLDEVANSFELHVSGGRQAFLNEFALRMNPPAKKVAVKVKAAAVKENVPSREVMKSDDKKSVLELALEKARLLKDK